MHKIGDVVPVLPVALMSEVILSYRGQWATELELKAAAASRIDELEQRGAPIKINASSCESVLGAALNMLEGRSFVETGEQGYRANENAIEVLSYYANSIVHWKRG
jgi:glycerol-3-phosphate O-acyltransferase